MGLLQTNETVIAKLVDDSPVAIVVSTDEDGQILDVNDRFLHLLGYSRDEVIGQTAAELGLWADPKQRAGLSSALIAGQTLSGVEVAVIAKSGAECQVLATMDYVDLDERPCLLTQMYDVTARNTAEEALLEAESRSRSLFDGAADAIFVADAEGRYLDTNPAALALLGYDREELLAMSVKDVVAEAPEWVASECARFRNERSWRGELNLRRKDGSSVAVESRVTIVDLPTGPVYLSTTRDISARKQAEDALRESEERFRGLVQNSYDIIVVFDAAGTRKYVSPSVERLLGYSPAELVGRSAVDLVHPDDAPRLQDAIQSCLQGAKETPVLELRFRQRDGSWRDFEAIGTNLLQEPGVAGIVFNSRDITSRNAAQAALRGSEERFRSAFAYAPIGIALVASDERFMQVNRALCELLGYPEEELLGKTFEAITHPDDLADGLEQAARLWAGEIDTYQLEKRVLHKDGHVVWIHLTGSLVRNASGPKYSIAQIVDITGRRHVEMDRAIMLASEREYTRQLRTLTEMRADLTAMIAHELRAPVAALRMMTFLLATGELSSQDEAEMIAAVKSEIEQLDRLISDVADVTTAEREDFSVQLNAVPLDVLFENAAAYARVTLVDHPFAVPPAPEVSIWCDPERISQVLRNLLDNAAKHTPSGTAVALRAHRDGTRVHLEVADHGPGLPAEERDSIFEKFGRGHSAAARQTPGAGLGLYLSRQIVHAHGSELTVASAPGSGTVFAFDLEVAP